MNHTRPHRWFAWHPINYYRHGPQGGRLVWLRWVVRWSEDSMAGSFWVYQPVPTDGQMPLTIRERLEEATSGWGR